MQFCASETYLVAFKSYTADTAEPLLEEISDKVLKNLTYLFIILNDYFSLTQTFLKIFLPMFFRLEDALLKFEIKEEGRGVMVYSKF